MVRFRVGLVSGVWMILVLLVTVFGVVLNVPLVKGSSGTIYIRADGSIAPSTAPMQRNGDLYTLTGNITSDRDGIVIERNNMTLDGGGYTLKGTASYAGIVLSDRINVAVINTKVVEFWYGISFEDSSNITLRGNEFTNCGLGWLWGSHGNVIENNTVNNKPLVYLENVSGYGISNAGQVVLVNCDNIRVENLDLSKTTFGVQLYETVNSVIVGNNITNNSIGICLSRSSNHNNILRNNITNNWGGIEISGSSYNNIARNHIKANMEFGLRNYASSNSIFGNTITGTNFGGLSLYDCSNCTIVENSISTNGYGIRLRRVGYNRIYHNKFVDNTNQVYIESGNPNVWDDGYPSGGNYWSNYTGVDLFKGPYQNETGSDGIGDISHDINAENRDRYPLMAFPAFEHTFVLKITTISGGTTNPPYGEHIYDGVLYDSITATPFVGYIFARWILDNKPAGTSNPTYVLMDRNHTLEAVFVPTAGQNKHVDWSQTYGTQNYDISYSLIQTSDSGFAMGGYWNVSSSMEYGFSYGIVRTDSVGKMQWNKSYSTGYTYNIPLMVSLMETNEGGLAFACSANFTGNPDYWLVKTDVDGNPLWNRTYGGVDWEILVSAVKTHDNGFMLTGLSFDGNKTAMWLVNTDEYGNVKWNKTYEDWFGRAVIETIDGGFAATGIISSNGSIYRMLLAMDSFGNVIWNKTYGQPLGGAQPTVSIYEFAGLLQTTDGGFVLVGTQIDNYDHDIIAIKTDEFGNVEWNKTYDNSCWESGFSIAQTYDGGYAIIGTTTVSQYGDQGNAWLVRTDTSGNVIWNSTYGGDGEDYGFSIVATDDYELAFSGGTNSFGAGGSDFWLVKLSTEILDDESPVVNNVRHEPLYPMSNDTIHFYADVTDNVAVSKVQLNYTENGGITWLLKDMLLSEGNTYSTSLGPYPQGQVLGFYVIAYDTSGNMAFGSEIVPPIPEPPKVAPVVVSDESPNPLPDGKDISYNVTDGGIDIYANVTEIGIYDPWQSYNITYSLDGGLTWINQTMTQIGDFIWKYWVNATTNILFKIIASDGSAQSRIYWIIVGPWKYPIYLYFSNDEKYFPVAGLDFDGDSTVENNWISYETTPDYWKLVFEENDLDNDGTRDVWSYSYMNPKSMDDGCLLIEYWIYYAFNEYAVLRPVFRGDHEHDFESVYLWIDVATGTIKKIALNQHNWVNHYTFSSPPKRLNIAVEKGGHGMVLLKDENDDGLPEDFDIFPGYDIWQPEGGGTFISGTWNDQSLVASLYPWVIYDPRIPALKLHLFGDPSVLTTGFSLEAISPLLPSIVDETPQYYNGLTNMLGYKYVLKTSYGAPLPLSEDRMLVFQVSAPWYRQEFQDQSKMWNKVPWITYTAKVTIKTLLPFIKAGIFSYFKTASTMQWVEKQIASILTGWIAGEIIDTLFDPIRGSVQDAQGKVLGYKDDKIVDEIPGSFVFLTRDMTNNMYDLYFILTNSTDDYIYEAKGESAETYNMTISSANIEGRQINFNAVNIPTKPNSIHRYIVHWDALERKEDGVEVWVDQNGDGKFESKFWSDGELTASEFELATADTTPPSTVHHYDGLWQTADFTINLTATDDPSGVAETYYRINNGPVQNVSSHGQPLITIESANNTLEYWSIDKVGNEELPHNFLTGIKLDKTVPSIGIPSREPSGDVQPNQPVKVSVNVTDATSQVKNATICYSLNNGTTWEPPIPMNYNTSTGLYEATIPGQQAEAWVRYKIIAYDYAGNNATLDGTEPYCVYQVIPEFLSSLILPLFVITTLLAAILCRRKQKAKLKTS